MPEYCGIVEGKTSYRLPLGHGPSISPVSPPTEGATQEIAFSQMWRNISFRWRSQCWFVYDILVSAGLYTSFHGHCMGGGLQQSYSRPLTDILAYGLHNWPLRLTPDSQIGERVLYWNPSLHFDDFAFAGEFNSDESPIEQNLDPEDVLKVCDHLSRRII